jgi:predicted MPP superfamily phosphohydrolase
LGGLLYARRVEPERVVVERVSLTLPHLAPAFDGYRILQVSDVHLDGWMTPERLRRIVELANKQRPDLTVATGDFVTCSPLYSTAHLAPLLVGPLADLRAPDGVLAVLGNHDHRAGAKAVRRALRAAGIVELDNRARTLRRGDGVVLHVAGVDSSYMSQDRLDLVLEGLPDEGCALLLAHEPDFADESAATGRFDLQLSGHSHGGQVRPPFLGPLLLPALGRRYPAGLYEVGGMRLYTNRGVGVTLSRLRANCPPEITVFTLRSPWTSADEDPGTGVAFDDSVAGEP